MARFCTSCGAALTEGQAFCGQCGAPAADAPAPGRPAAAVNRNAVQPAPASSASRPVGGLIHWIEGLPIPISASSLAGAARYVETKRPLERQYPIRVHPVACALLGWVGASVGGWILSVFLRPILYRMLWFAANDVALAYLMADILNAAALIAGARVAIAYWQAARPYHPLSGPSTYANPAAGWTPEKTRRVELGATIVIAVALAMYVFGMTQRYIHGVFGMVLYTMFRRQGNDVGGVAGFVITAVVVALCLRVLTPAVEAIVQES